MKLLNSQKKLSRLSGAQDYLKAEAVPREKSQPVDVLRDSYSSDSEASPPPSSSGCSSFESPSSSFGTSPSCADGSNFSQDSIVVESLERQLELMQQQPIKGPESQLIIVDQKNRETIKKLRDQLEMMTNRIISAEQAVVDKDQEVAETKRLLARKKAYIERLKQCIRELNESVSRCILEDYGKTGYISELEMWPESDEDD